MRTVGIVPTLTVGLFAAAATAQDHFPDPIPTSDLEVKIQDFAVIPDSSPDTPARMNVLTRDPLGRIFVNDQRGPLYTVSNDGANVTEYLDLRDFSELAIVASFEQGFQGFAMHPDFANAGTDGFGRFYTAHSTSDTSPTPDFDPGGGTTHHSVVLEWRTNDPTASTFTPADAAAPYREIMRFDQPFVNHNVQHLSFNPLAGPSDTDYGNLYIPVGDGGDADDPLETGQDTSNPYGAILRINPLGSDSANGKYGIVSDNALASDGDDNTLGEIFAYGLRNPHRYTFDSETGTMYISDIGQNTVEEINVGVNGGNFGWDDREGSFPFESTDDVGIGPVAEYDHTNIVSDPPSNIDRTAIVTGDVARGTGIPGLDGNLIFSDFPTGLLFTLDVDNDALDGGQDGILELRPLDDEMDPSRLLELINVARLDRGLAVTNRADIRFGLNTPGELFILNKQDGIIRQLTVVPEPASAAILGLMSVVALHTTKRRRGA